MKSNFFSIFAGIAGASALLILGTGCGTDSTPSSSSFLPSVDFSMSTTATGDTSRVIVSNPTDLSRTLSHNASGTLLGVDTVGPLVRWANRIQKVINDVSLVLTRLETDGVSTTGTFSEKGPGKNISGKVEAITDETYAYSATICKTTAGTATPFLNIKWNADKNKVLAVRNHAVKPGMRNGEGSESDVTLVSEVTYTVSATATTVDIKAHGTPFAMPANHDGESLTDSFHGTKATDGAITVKGVTDWWSTTAPTTYTGDAYIVGSIAAAGTTGTSVGFDSSNTACASVTFDDTKTAATDAPGWCLGRALGSDTNYTATELATEWATLSAVGIAPASELEAITFDSTFTCE